MEDPILPKSRGSGAPPATPNEETDRVGPVYHDPAHPVSNLSPELTRPGISTRRSPAASALSAVRLAFGSGLIGLSLWALFLPPIFPTSDYAVVNAKLVAIKASDPGKVTNLSDKVSPLKEVGGLVATVTRDLLKMQRELEQSQFARTKIQEQLQNLDQLIEARQSSLTEARSAAATARENAKKATERTLGAAREKVRLTEETLMEKQAGEARVAALLKDGIVTSAQWSETRQQTLEAEKMMTSAKLELASAEAKLNTFHQGSGGQVASEVEALASRIDSIDSDLAKLKVQRLDLQSELASAENKIAAVKAHNLSDLNYDLTTPIRGVIWRQHVANGENLREGQIVADVADAENIYIEAFFRQEFIKSIAVGDKTTIQLVPGTQILSGRVVDIQVQDSSSKGPSIINTGPIGNWMLRVVIKTDSTPLQTENIGKMAKVLISKPDASFAQKALMALTLSLKGHK